MINTCVECGNEFEHKRLAKVCKPCQEKPIECPVCKTEFVRKATNQSCCSSDCTKKYKKLKPKKPKITKEQMESEMNADIEEDTMDMTIVEFDVKPKAGKCVIEKCENCGGTKFIFSCGGTNTKGHVEYRCATRGCAYTHFFRWGYDKKEE